MPYSKRAMAGDCINAEEAPEELAEALRRLLS
jgi:hypothetical protein